MGHKRKDDHQKHDALTAALNSSADAMGGVIEDHRQSLRDTQNRRGKGIAGLQHSVKPTDSQTPHSGGAMPMGNEANKSLKRKHQQQDPKDIELWTAHVDEQAPRDGSAQYPHSSTQSHSSATGWLQFEEPAKIRRKRPKPAAKRTWDAEHATRSVHDSLGWETETSVEAATHKHAMISTSADKHPARVNSIVWLVFEQPNEIKVRKRLPASTNRSSDAEQPIHHQSTSWLQ